MATLALVGDRSAAVRSHTRVPGVLDALRTRDGLVLDPEWISSDEAADAALERFDAIWVTPGSPYRDPEGAIGAIRTAREHAVPFLGTCGGFQHAVLALARDLAGIAGASHAEDGEGGDDVIVALACSLVGQEGGITCVPGSRIAAAMGTARSVERYHCSYGLDPSRRAALEAVGVAFTAHDDDGDARALELPDHPFFLGTLFQPELAGDGTVPHPVIRAFAEAAVATAAARTPGATAGS